MKKFKKINLNINLKEVLNFMPDIDFNINDYNLDLVLADIESVDIMEQYGEMK